MTYSVNGVALDNASLGWTLVRGSIPVLPVEINNPGQEKIGVDGVTHYFATRRPSSFRFIVKASLDTRGDLMALFSQPTITVTNSEKPGWSASGRLISSSVEEYHEAKNWAADLFIVEIPLGAWRGTEETTALLAPNTPNSTLTLFSGISTPVQDALVRFKGPIQDPQVVDQASGAYLQVLGTINANNYLRFDMGSGRAWTTTTDVWTGGTEVTGNLDYGGPRSVFEITPRFPTAGNPLIRNAQLVLTQQSYGTGAGVAVRGRNAYIL